MRAGELRDRVTIRHKAEGDDGHGGFSETDAVIASRIPANVQPLSGRELDRAQQIDPRARYAVILRFRLGITRGLELIYHAGGAGDRTFEIVAPPTDVDSRHEKLELLCAEAAA